LKIDPTGQLLKEFIAINNRVLDRFSEKDQKKIGVHVCPGGDCDCYVSTSIFVLNKKILYVFLAFLRN
jgi:5-methyltetrahydropteroyltriglutamate--homocysteine methyltransferase